MDKDRRRKLLESMGLDEEAMLGDHGSSEEERKFEELVEKALNEGKIPTECIQLIPVSEELAAKVVIYHEC